MIRGSGAVCFELACSGAPSKRAYLNIVLILFTVTPRIGWVMRELGNIFEEQHTRYWIIQ